MSSHSCRNVSLISVHFILEVVALPPYLLYVIYISCVIIKLLFMLTSLQGRNRNKVFLEFGVYLFNY
jgi:hypothetical protein